MTSKETKTENMEIKMTLIAKGIKVEKVCTTQREVEVFKRDMPAKYDLLFSGKAYAIGQRNLNA